MSESFIQKFLPVLLIGMFFSSCQTEEISENKVITSEFRAPAYPLVTIDPYTSAWSISNRLYDTPVKHWTGRTFSLIGAARVDGKVYRFLGKEELPLQPVVPNAKYGNWDCKYSVTQPAKNWEKPEFNDISWKTGKGAFGSLNRFDEKTEWRTEDIWVRRTFRLSEAESAANLYAVYSHDNDFELYLNGSEIVRTDGGAEKDIVIPLDKNLLKADSENVLAAHCHDRGGWRYIDFGIFNPLFVSKDRKAVS